VKFLPRCLCMRDDWKNTIYEWINIANQFKEVAQIVR
jgi:hypothetical protein